MVTRTMYVFSFPVYALFDHGSTLSFVTPLVDSKFYLLSEILHEPLLVLRYETTLVIKEYIQIAQ